MKTDYNCFIGSWPFIKRRQVDFDGLRRMHERHGIETGLVSSLGAAFYNDSFEGDIELAQTIKGSGYSHAISINPLLPNTGYDIKRADESFEYDAFRIYPTVHGYNFDSPRFIEFFHMAAGKNKPVLIHCSFGDFRLDYLLRQKPFEAESLKLFLKSGHKLPVVLCNMKLGEMGNMANFLKNDNNVYVDMSEMRHSMFALDDISGMGFADKVVFGSFYPVFDFMAAYIHFKGEDLNVIDGILKRKII